MGSNPKKAAAEKLRKAMNGEMSDNKDTITHVKDKRFSVYEEPVLKKNKLEDMKYQPKSQSSPSKSDLKHMRSNAHYKSVPPPDQQEMNQDNGMKSKKKKMAAMAIRKRMKNSGY